MATPRTESPRAALVRAGVLNTDRGLAFIEELGDWAPGVIRCLAKAPDPDQALLTLTRLREVMDDQQRTAVADTLNTCDVRSHRLICVVGASVAFGDHLVKHPQSWTAVVDAAIDPAPDVRAEMVAAVEGVLPGTGGAPEAAYDALRVAYDRRVCRIAAIDLTSDPFEVMPVIAEALAEAAGAALEAAHRIACSRVADSDQVRLAVIAMGKTGGRELNYISDVDVIFAAEAAPGVPEQHAMRIGAEVASELMRACSTRTAEGSLWQVDAALRPEGKAGPLVRSVENHRHYYERWASTWEFQALLKARPVAGDPEVGQAYLDAVQPFVWQASSRDNFVADVQAMRRRVEQLLPPGEADRELKLGKGGLRDIEFSVQLLQLVHGRTDARLRVRSTLSGLESLSRGGYVGRTDAHDLDDAYRALRVLEHRIQMWRMKRTHLMPVAETDLRRLGRAVGFTADPVRQVQTLRAEESRKARRLHERLFYRPLLSAVARLTEDDARLTTQDAQERLAALGYRDPAGAMRHIAALTVGVSRRAAIQRTLLPVLLRRFADEADPDMGLLAFRKVSDALGSTHWYLKMLRDEGGAADILARVLASSRYVGGLIERAPSSVAMFGDSDALRPRPRTEIAESMHLAIERHRGEDKEAVTAVRTIRRTELIRIATADLSGRLELLDIEDGLTDLTAATLQAVLDVAVRAAQRAHGTIVTRVAIIGMGRLGGGETGYSSDADVLFVHDPLPGADAQLAQSQAERIVTEVRRWLSGAGPDPALGIDADLRPEGRSGPLVRTLESYAAYYARWSEGWEAQALLRATPVAGDVELGERFIALIDPLRYPVDGISAAAIRQIRLLKARVEAERIPRGGDPLTHLKLGRGGLSDVEWTVQLVQLRYAGRFPQIRNPATITPLRAMVDCDLVSAEHADALEQSWTMATRIRNASVLWRGRPVDSLPSDVVDANGIASILGMGQAAGETLRNDYLRMARRARNVMEREFYDQDPDAGRDREPTR